MDDEDAGSGPGLTSLVVVLDMPVDRRARYTNAMASGAPNVCALSDAGGRSYTASQDSMILSVTLRFHDFCLFV